jgi:hypothetical protein
MPRKTAAWLVGKLQGHYKGPSPFGYAQKGHIVYIYQLFQQEVEFLGKLVSSDGIQIAPSKAEAVQKWPVPTTRKELMSFLRFVNYHRDHVPNFACLTACLFELAHQQGHREWKPEHDEAFQQTKQALSTAPSLAYPNPVDKFILGHGCFGSRYRWSVV